MKRMKSLRELLMKEVHKFDRGPIASVLGEDMPDISPSPLGRIRLVKALARKFGEDFRSVPSAKRALDHFDNEVRLVRGIAKIRGFSHG